MALTSSLLRDTGDTQVVNALNHGTLPFLPDDAVIEVPATVDATGADAASRTPPGTAVRRAGRERHRLRAPRPGGGAVGQGRPEGRPGRCAQRRLLRPPRPPPHRPERLRGPAHRRADRAQPGAPHVGLTGTALAIDAGNSKTDVALVTADGRAARDGTRRRFPATGGGRRPGGRRAGAAGGGRSWTRPGLTGPVGHLSAFLANADLPVEEAELTAEVAGRGWARTVSVRNDTFALLRAGLPDDGEPVGVAVVCGAGINCAGLGRQGAAARFPAIGRHLRRLGRRFLPRRRGAVVRGPRRGRPRRTDRAGPRPARPLRPEHHAGADRGPPSAGPPRPPPPRTDPGALRRRGFRRPGRPRHRGPPGRGDRPAGRQSPWNASDLLGEPAPVVLGGGVLAARHPLLHEQTTRLLSERAPKAVPQVVTAPPVLGAALDTLDRAGAAAGAYGRLRGAWG